MRSVTKHYPVEQRVRAVKRVLDHTGRRVDDGLTHHSDAGSQYT